jgi:hypothetical protein
MLRSLGALCFCILLAGGVPAQEQKDPKEQKDPIVERMRKDITFLASDECEGRGVGTKGLDKAADFIADEFTRAGLKPAGIKGSWFQPFPFATNAELDGDSTMVLSGPKGQSITLKQGTDFQVLGLSGPGKVKAPLVFVGYGATARGINYDDYANMDVAGKAVVALRRLPRWKNERQPFDGSNKDELASLENKQTTALANKAGALILVNDASELPKDELVSFKAMAKGISTVSIPFVQIKRSVLQDVLNKIDKQGLEDIEKAIDADLKPHSRVLQGWTVDLDVKIKRKEVMVKNVIGVLEGEGPLAQETVVVGAHYDHLGYGGRGSLAKDKKKDIHHGADDNASGTTTVIELARRFGAMKNRKGRRLVFMTFTAEESGLIGSRHYCRVAPLFPLEDTVAMFNLDMVGRLRDTPKGGKLLVEGTDTAKEFDDLVAKLNPGFEVVKEKSVFGASDHYSFYTKKIPVIFFWTGNHSDYHRPSDTADKINVVGMKRIADYAERVIDNLRTEAKRPEYVAVPLRSGGGASNFPKLGIMPDYTFGGKGVLVEGIIQGGAAEKAGLKKGDVIIEIGRQPVPNVDGYMAALRKQRSGTEIDIKVLRDGKELQLTATPK